MKLQVSVVGLAFFLVAGTAAGSDSDGPPKTVLKRGELRQQGNLGSYCWTPENGPGQCADRFGYDWPRAKRAASGKPARITIKYAERPDRLSLTYYRRTDGDGNPKGSGQKIEYTLEERTTEGGSQVWDARFVLPDYDGHFYLRSFAKWDAGDASYSYHLRLN